MFSMVSKVVTLFVKNPVENKAHEIIMDISLIPIKGEGMRIAQFDEVHRKKVKF